MGVVQVSKPSPLPVLFLRQLKQYSPKQSGISVYSQWDTAVEECVW